MWENFAACRWTASTTFGCEWPTMRQPSPLERSSMVLPSTSVTAAPNPWSMTAFTCRSSGSHTTRSFRSMMARDIGPGSSVFISIVGTAFLLVDGCSSAGSFVDVPEGLGGEGYRGRGFPTLSGRRAPGSVRRRRERVERGHELFHGPDQSLEPAELRRILPEPACPVARLRQPPFARDPLRLDLRCAPRRHEGLRAIQALLELREGVGQRTSGHPRRRHDLGERGLGRLEVHEHVVERGERRLHFR